MITVDKISKKFKIYLNPWHRGLEWATFGREKLHQEFWALQNISFDVSRGECLGIIGPNGAGKSTLLKILTRALYPTAGAFAIQGRVLSLLELGTGFNPELTGGQNLYNSVRLLGLPKEYLEDRIADIEAFAGLGDFFDRPVKLYSSGMYVRLAFSLFAFLKPEVLIIDETLSVGDIFFQQKSFAKMREIISGGTTCLFVSHDTAAVQNLCQQAILLEKGEIAFMGDAKEAVGRYYAMVGTQLEKIHTRERKKNLPDNHINKIIAPVEQINKPISPEEILAHNIIGSGSKQYGRGGAKIIAVRLVGIDERDTRQVEMMGNLHFYLLIRANEDIVNPSVGIQLFDRMGNLVFGGGAMQLRKRLPDFFAGDEIIVKMDIKLNVQPGEYTFSVGVSEPIPGQGTNDRITQVRCDLLGPFLVTADFDKPLPFYGIARLPMNLEYYIINKF